MAKGKKKQLPDQAYRAADLAEVFGLTTRTIYRYKKAGIIPSYCPTKRTTLYPRAAIRALLNRGHNLQVD